MTVRSETPKHISSSADWKRLFLVDETLCFMSLLVVVVVSSCFSDKLRPLDYFFLLLLQMYLVCSRMFLYSIAIIVAENDCWRWRRQFDCRVANNKSYPMEIYIFALISSNVKWGFHRNRTHIQSTENEITYTKIADKHIKWHKQKEALNTPNRTVLLCGKNSFSRSQGNHWSKKTWWIYAQIYSFFLGIGTCNGEAKGKFHLYSKINWNVFLGNV